MKIKEKDIFNFQYNPRQEQGWDSRTHCFDGRFLAIKEDDQILLVDTYWGYGDKQGRIFTQEKAEALGKLTFVANMEDLEKSDESCYSYYDDSDCFNLSYQHGCYKKYAIKKGAVKSKEKMLQILKQQMQKAKRELESIGHRIEDLSKDITLVEGGETDIYIRYEQ